MAKTGALVSGLATTHSQILSEGNTSIMGDFPVLSMLSPLNQFVRLERTEPIGVSIKPAIIAQTSFGN